MESTVAKTKAKPKLDIPELTGPVSEYVEREIALLYQRALEIRDAYNDERDKVRTRVMKAKGVTMEMVAQKKVKDYAQYYEAVMLSVAREKDTGGLQMYWNKQLPKGVTKNRNGYVKKGKTQNYSEKALRKLAREWNHANIINAELHAAELRTLSIGLMAIKKAVINRCDALKKATAKCRRARIAAGGRQIEYGYGV